MDPTVDVALKIGGGVVTLGVGAASRRIVAEFKHQRTKRFWRPIAKSRPLVVVGTHRLDGWEATVLMSVGEAKAIEELRGLFASLYLPDLEVSYGDDLPTGRT